MFWRGGTDKKSVLAWREWQEKYLGVTGAAKKCFGVSVVGRKVFWHGGSGKKSVLVWREWQEKCFGVAGVAKKVR